MATLPGTTTVEPARTGTTDDAIVTVVVPARDEEACIAACLASVLAQDHPALQIVVVIDARSADGTRSIVERLAATDGRVEIVDNPDGGIPAALNRGLDAARGRWFVRVDAHSTVPPSYVSSLVARLQTARWAGVGGRKDADPGDGGETARAIAVALGSPAGVGNSAYHYATTPREVDHVPFGAYPTDLLRRLGGWDRSLEANEDYELDLRIRETGGSLLLDPSVRVRWRSRATLADLARQYRRYGAGKADVARLHPRSLGFRHLAPPAAVAWLAASAVAGARRPRALWLAAPYAAFVAAAAAVTARRAEPAASTPRVGAALAVMHLAWGAGFLARLGRILVRSVAASDRGQAAAAPTA